jgi:hypothetical protein
MPGQGACRATLQPVGLESGQDEEHGHGHGDGLRENQPGLAHEWNPMASRTDIASYTNHLLDVGRFRDYRPNGLQVEGRDEIRTP